MTSEFKLNDKVVIDKLTPQSYTLYKRYEKTSPLVECACHFKHDLVLDVVGVFKDGVLLLQRGERLTVVYSDSVSLATK